MPERLSLLILGVLLSGGFASAGEHPSRLTLVEAADHLRRGFPVYACDERPDWFSGEPGQCFGGVKMEWVEEIKNGKAVFGRGRGSGAGETTNRNTMEKNL